VLKPLRLAVLAGLSCAAAAAASPAGDIGGTWECRQPGVRYDNKPPILFVADTGGAQGLVDVDGFSRRVYGRSEVTPDQGGWWKVKPAQGPEFMVRPEAAKQGTPTMGVRLADATAEFQCLRLPPSAAQSIEARQGAPAAEAAPAAQEVMPATQEVMPAAPATPDAEAADKKSN